MKTEWFYVEGGQQYGPMSPKDIKKKASAGSITRDTLVWREGMDNWAPLAIVPEFRLPPPKATKPPTKKSPSGKSAKPPRKEMSDRRRNEIADIATRVAILIAAAFVGLLVYLKWPDSGPKPTEIAMAKEALINHLDDPRHEQIAKEYELGAWYPIDINPNDPDSETYVVRIALYEAEYAPPQKPADEDEEDGPKDVMAAKKSLADDPELEGAVAVNGATEAIVGMAGKFEQKLEEEAREMSVKEAVAGEEALPPGTFRFTVKKVVERQPTQLVKSLGLPVHQELYAVALVTERTEAEKALNQRQDLYRIQVFPTKELSR